MRKTYTIRNTQELACPEIGTLELDSSVGPLAFLELAKNGYLNIVGTMSAEQADAIRAEQERNEADLEDPEGAQARTQAEIDAAAAKLPEGDYKLEDLRPKQLKALCQQLGLKDYGTGETLLERIKEHRLAEAKIAEEREKAAAGEADQVNLDDMTVKELKAVARGYGVSDKGKREDLIQRILVAAEAAEDGADGEEDQTDLTDQTDLEEDEPEGDTPPAPEITAGTAVPHSLDESSEGLAN
jgi:hypothetical protein